MHLMSIIVRILFLCPTLFPKARVSTLTQLSTQPLATGYFPFAYLQMLLKILSTIQLIHFRLDFPLQIFRMIARIECTTDV